MERNPDLGRILHILAETTEAVRAGTLAPAVGNSIASLSRASIAGISTLADADRLHELEKLLDELKSTDRPARRLKALM